MASQAQQTVNTGNTILLTVDNRVIGRAQSLQAQRSYGTEGVYEIGSIMPQEHVYNRYEGQITLQRFWVRKDTLVELGMTGLGEDILTKGVMDIAVFQKGGATGTDGTGEGQQVDFASAKCLRVYRGCTAVTYTETVNVGQICGENATFQYMTCDDNTNTGNGGYLSGTQGSYTDGYIGGTVYDAGSNFQINGLTVGASTSAA